MQAIMSAGKLIPSRLTVDVVVNALQKHPSKAYLLDGFPRAVEQAEMWK